MRRTLATLALALAVALSLGMGGAMALDDPDESPSNDAAASVDVINGETVNAEQFSVNATTVTDETVEVYEMVELEESALDADNESADGTAVSANVSVEAEELDTFAVTISEEELNDSTIEVQSDD